LFGPIPGEIHQLLPPEIIKQLDEISPPFKFLKHHMGIY